MQRKVKYFNNIQIFGNIGLLIVFILVLTTNIKNIFNLYWLMFGIAFLGNVIYLNKWSKEGKTWYKKRDKSYTDNLTRKQSDLLLFIMVAYTLIVCGLYIIEFFIPSITLDLSVIISFYILTIVFEYVIYVIVVRTFKEVNKLIDKDGVK